MYNYVSSAIEGMRTGDIISIDVPDKLKAFRKFLCEIAARDHKKFTTKVKDGQLHIMRINYHSVVERLSHD